eukprot:COSAG02_NODE_13107_length_1445_cov_1.367013_1_plen_83_part_00
MRAYRSAAVGKLDMGGLPVGADEARGAAVGCSREANVNPNAPRITRSSCIRRRDGQAAAAPGRASASEVASVGSPTGTEYHY